MKPGWVIGFAILFISGGMISGLLEGVYLGTFETGVFSTLLTGVSYVSSGNPMLTMWGLFVVPFGVMGALWQMFLADYAMYEGSWAIVRWTVLIPISLGVLVSFILAVVRGVSSS